MLSCTGTLATTLGSDQPFRYRGYVYDAETGWYYLQSRYYSPETCRFISADVLLSTGQGVLGHNSFAYCLNNPVCRSDSGGAVSYGAIAVSDGWGVPDGDSPYTDDSGNASASCSPFCGNETINVWSRTYGTTQCVYATAYTITYFGSNNIPVARGTGMAPKNDVLLAYGRYYRLDSNGSIMSTAYYDAYGSQYMRYDHYGHTHAGASPHIHFYGYNEWGLRNYKGIYDKEWYKIN